MDFRWPFLPRALGNIDVRKGSNSGSFERTIWCVRKKELEKRALSVLSETRQKKYSLNSRLSLCSLREQPHFRSFPISALPFSFNLDAFTDYRAVSIPIQILTTSSAAFGVCHRNDPAFRTPAGQPASHLEATFFEWKN